MFGKKNQKIIEQKLDDLTEKVRLIAERQNSQYTDIMLLLKEATLDNVTIIDKRTTDEMYEEALKLVIKKRVASTSYLQRKLALGYSHAAKIMDMLEAKGVIGPSRGSKPREVFIKEDNEERTL